jgi:hypothetical protein
MSIRARLLSVDTSGYGVPMGRLCATHQWNFSRTVLVSASRDLVRVEPAGTVADVVA